MPVVTDIRRRHWWHLFAADCEPRPPGCGVGAYVLTARSDEPPGTLTIRLATGIETTRCFKCGRLVELEYLRSWEREPSEDEIVSAYWVVR